MQFSTNYFEPDGPLSTLEGYEYRREQQEMANQINEVLVDGHIGVIEAGTGTGKSLAYLYPAVCHSLAKGERVVVSTNTINLQDQLLAKDIPILKKLGLKFNVVVVKGWNNYPCWQRLNDALELDPNDSALKKLLHKLESDDPESQPLFNNLAIDIKDEIQAESDLCTRGRCSFFDQCPVFVARRLAEKANILIVNHHLLLADISIRRHTGWDETAVLPVYRHVIVDEAHHIEDVATNYFGISISLLRLRRLLGHFYRKHGKQRGILPAIRKRVSIGTSESANDVLKLIDWQLLPILRAIDEAAIKYFSNLSQYIHQQPANLDNLRITNQDLERPEMLQSYDHLHTEFINFEKQLKKLANILAADDSDKLDPFLHRVKAYRADLEFLMDIEDSDYVYWLSKSKRHQVSLQAAPIKVGDSIREHFLLGVSSVIFTSATLAANRDFTYFVNSIGIDYPQQLDLKTCIFHSPFDYQNQAYLGVVKDLPLPDEPSFIELFSSTVESMLPLTEGRAFVLFTSYQMLNQVVTESKKRGVDKKFNFLIHGELDRTTMVDRFKHESNAVLFGTDSFWEGVDVAGDALSIVIISKLPFRVPTDPIVASRSERLQAEGKNPFLTYFLPQAVLKFRQGCGRLIRTTTDRGIILICDKRIMDRDYGRYFLKSLPECDVHYNELAKIQQEVKEWL